MLYNFWRSVALSKASGKSLADPTFTAPALRAQHSEIDSAHPSPWHRRIEGAPLLFSGLVLIAVIVGGPLEYIPLSIIKENIPTIASVKPYTPLELEGRDIYIREGCHNCHSQMVRPFRDEVMRYGEYSKAGEFIYDHPFQFGSKRSGPDLHRVGGKYPDFWHYRHMQDPRSTSPGSLMPAYPWLYETDLDISRTPKKLSVLRSLGVPYQESDIEQAQTTLRQQASALVANLVSQGASTAADLEHKEITAMIAYLQRLGRDIQGGTP
jgi:cytochrome c oxidase cbb3-type subunit I/II